MSGCNDCCTLRYEGPDIDELGISNGDLIEVAIQNISQYITSGGSGAISTLVDNGDGSYTHTPGDSSGVSTTFTTGTHTFGPTAPLNPNYGDTWYDTTDVELKWFTNNGSIDIWEIAQASPLARFKEETIHHNSTTTLNIDPSLHNKREILFENTGDIEIDGSLHLVTDDYTYLISNGTSVDRVITFQNVIGAFLRDGGAIIDNSVTGFTIPSNTTILVTVTNQGGFATVEGHFYALEITGDPIGVFGAVIDLVEDIAYPLTVPTMVEANSIEIYSNTLENITNGINQVVVGDTITLGSNVSLTGVKVRVIFNV